MFRLSARMFSSGRIVASSINSSSGAASAPAKAHPTLAAKQFISPDASKSKAKILRRKEKRLKKQIIRDVNNYKKQQAKNVQFQVDPVLGEVDNGFMNRIKKEVENHTNHLAYGFDRVEFEKLLYGAEKAALDKSKGTEVLNESIRLAEERKKRALLTILNLRNTNKMDKKILAIKLAREEFQRQEGDTASPEVQAAILTVKIHFGMDHVKESPKDHTHTEHVRQMVQHRQRILKYLKRDNPEKYYYTIAKLGLTDDVITREFNMGRQYFQDFKVWGDKQLVKLSDKQQSKVNKIHDLQKRVSEYNDLARKNYDILQKEQSE
ncbi:predicted protein [Scheffersomyces stipitis CBS 6054]|uniref:37S ribosomal protein S28, mitochondrial n=1 Tax=Scheffersomyces stipitis (strain ATCC 58785 / CBS 6054 / NBRC 10063 / NRRL Y-11545) TaxID=322104 RepID=A3M0H1_PICST|nr:mitochondrial 37S ribosomal protein MRPS28 [Scheffersomyces stipitis CBS 6054]ABN68707.1 predicted protein [Scheffersomyces stipitis CBS 6054]KAG2730973.1 hypothetical protein G9P44_006122 [Scheffersomyces stipitis]